jgi:predicted enzyme related to lactoylglutathione lyase
VDVLSSRVIVRVIDFERSRTFYERTLGLSIFREYGMAGVTTGVVFFLGGGHLEITAADGSAAPTGAILWLQVPDVVAEERRLAMAGVTVVRSAERMPWGLVECWIEDPDGNELRLIEVPPDHPIRSRVD